MSVPYTRVTEYKHLTGQVHPQTSLTYEYPAADGDPYYPVPRPENAELYRKYQALADATPDVTFVGRLGTYRYYNMDQVVGQALALFNRIAETEKTARRSGAGRPWHGADERHRPCRSRPGRRRLSAENIGMHRPELFDSFFMGGFECSTHRRHDGRRLDLITATGHDKFFAEDYRRDDRARHPDGSRRGALAPHRAAPGRFDWSSFLPMLHASRAAGVQPIWDLCHYGWPDDIDIWQPNFVDRFASFAAAVARW